jgi:phage terminase large subunit
MYVLLLAIMSSLIFNPLTLEQKQAFENQAFHLLLWGPGYSGKTQIGVHKGIWAGLNYSDNRIFFIRKKKVDLRTSTWLRFKEILPSGLMVKLRDQDMYCKIRNGSEFFGFGLDSEADVNKLASTECGMTITEEATEVPEIYYDEKIVRSCRLRRVPFHQNLLLCNPGAPAHWIFHNFIIPSRKPEYENIFMPTLPQEYIPDVWWNWFQGLVGIFAERYQKGKWIGAQGLVYPFDPMKHIIKSFPIPRDWPREKALDFGFALQHAFSAGWFALEPTNDLPIWHLYRQIYMTGRIVEDHAVDMKRWDEHDGTRHQAWVCDHDAEDRATLNKHGIKTIPAYKDRLAGQQEVHKVIAENRLKIHDNSLLEPDLELRMKKLPTCVEEEFPLYEWASRGKEDMIKQHDNGMDMIRYGIATKYRRPRSSASNTKPTVVQRSRSSMFANQQQDY